MEADGKNFNDRGFENTLGRLRSFSIMLVWVYMIMISIVVLNRLVALNTVFLELNNI